MRNCKPLHTVESMCRTTNNKERTNCYVFFIIYFLFLYSAVSSPLDRSKRFTLSSPGRPVHSDTVLGFSCKHSSHAAIAQRLFTHISTTVYSQVLIYTAESTEATWSERKCPNFDTVAKGDSNPGSLDCESGILPLSYGAPQYFIVYSNCLAEWTVVSHTDNLTKHNCGHRCTCILFSLLR